MKFYDWVEKMQQLDDGERSFVFSVIRSSGGKYPHNSSSYKRDGKTPLWKLPEELGLISCTGSWKWDATFVE